MIQFIRGFFILLAMMMLSGLTASSQKDSTYLVTYKQLKEVRLYSVDAEQCFVDKAILISQNNLINNQLVVQDSIITEQDSKFYLSGQNNKQYQTDLSSCQKNNTVLTGKLTKRTNQRNYLGGAALVLLLLLLIIK